MGEWVGGWVRGWMGGQGAWVQHDAGGMAVCVSMMQLQDIQARDLPLHPTTPPPLPFPTPYHCLTPTCPYTPPPHHPYLPLPYPTPHH